MGHTGQIGHIGQMSFSIAVCTDRINIPKHQSEINIKLFIEQNKFFIGNKISGFGLPDPCDGFFCRSATVITKILIFFIMEPSLSFRNIKCN